MSEPATEIEDEADEQTEFKFAELSEQAQQRAIEWYREGVTQDWEPDLDDIATVLGYLGFEVAQESYTTFGGAVKTRPGIRYSIGFCQGDYATFDATWKATDLDFAKVLEDYPQDELLHLVGAHLMRVFLAHPDATAQVRGQTDHRNLWVDYAHARPDDDDTCEGVELPVRNAARDLETWVYHRLSEELLYQGSDAACREGIEANDYIFDEEGAVL